MSSNAAEPKKSAGGGVGARVLRHWPFGTAIGRKREQVNAGCCPPGVGDFVRSTLSENWCRLRGVLVWRDADPMVDMLERSLD